MSSRLTRRAKAAAAAPLRPAAAAPPPAFRVQPTRQQAQQQAQGGVGAESVRASAARSAAKTGKTGKVDPLIAGCAAFMVAVLVGASITSAVIKSQPSSSLTTEKQAEVPAGRDDSKNEPRNGGGNGGRTDVRKTSARAPETSPGANPGNRSGAPLVSAAAVADPVPAGEWFTPWMAGDVLRATPDTIRSAATGSGSGVGSGVGSYGVAASQGALLPTELAEVIWPQTSVKQDAGASVSGHLSGLAGSPAVAGREVEVQLRTPALGGAVAWRTVGTTRTSKGGEFRVALPTTWVRTSMPVRVSVQATSTHETVVSSPRRFDVVPGTPLRPKATSWAPLAPQETWRVNPCQTVTWRLNATGAGPGAYRDTAQALERVHEATGIRFKYLGSTSAIFGGTRAWPGDTTLLVSWARPAQTRWPASDAIAHGGAQSGVYVTGPEGRVVRIDRAGVMMDSTVKFAPGFAGPVDGIPDRGAVLMHELGHALGLGHVEDRSQLMYPVILERAATWGAGDVRGFSKVGMRAGCLP